MNTTKKFKIELDVWCTSEKDFDMLLREMQHNIFFADNTGSGGVGCEFKLTEDVEKKLFKKLFNKRLVECDCEE